MRKYLIIQFCLFALSFISCNKSYKYVETVEETDLFGHNTIKTDDAVIISAPSDSMAYLEAFKKFTISKKVYMDMVEAGSGSYLDRPISFKLYDSNGKNITNIIFFSKSDKELEISESILSKPNDIKERFEERQAIIAQDQIARRDSVKIKELIPFFRVSKDEFDVNGVTWYEPNDAPKYINRNGIYIYFGVDKNGIKPLRLKIQYTADDWLFFKKVNFSIDDKPFEYVPRKTETDHGGGIIWEWSDEAIVDTSDKELIKALASAKSAKMKFIGSQYHNIKNISQKQIQSINRTIELYKAMGGDF